jgi:endoglucanase
MYMLATLGVGGSWPGNPNPSGYSADMKIDYIRAYSSDATIPAINLQTVSSPDGVDTTPYGVATAGGVLQPGGTTPAPIPPPTPTPTGLTVRVSEDAWNGDAQFKVLVDGNQVGGIQTATAHHGQGQWQDITLAGNFDSGAHNVRVEFLNDGWGGTSSMDRNLYVQSVDINGQHIAGSAAINSAANGSAWVDPSAAVMMIDGTADFHAGSGTSTTPTPPPTSSTGSMTLHVSEDAWNGDAQFKVLVDGNQVGGIQTATAHHSQGQWQDIALTGNFDDGAHTVRVEFLNDAWGGSSSMDRNLYVQSIDINGQHIAGSTALNSAANGSASADPSAAVMMVNGTADFKAGAGTSTPPPPGSAASTITFHISEDAWNGDAQFKVLVDGNQVGGVQTATAAHSQGQVQDITLTEDFGSLGPDKVSVQFLNDSWGGNANADRNLYVQSIDVNGVHVAGNTAANNAANGSAWVDPGAAVMMTNGTATFDVHHNAPPDLWHA